MEFNIAINELEYKYSADKIKLSDFVDFAKNLFPVKSVDVSSWDYYYTPRKKNSVQFMRYRAGTHPELTIKHKLSSNNNNNRIETDIPIDPSADAESTLAIINAYTDLLGFSLNFKIYKYCRIFYFEKTTLVYYISFNEEMKEVGRYIEVEARKDYPFKNKEIAWKEVKDLEKKLSSLKITEKNRMKKSQFEINKKTLPKNKK